MDNTKTIAQLSNEQSGNRIINVNESQMIRGHYR